MGNKLFWKSKTFWTQLLGFIVITLTAVIPNEYKEILLSGEALVMAILTMVFRWGGETQPLGIRK